MKIGKCFATLGDQTVAPRLVRQLSLTHLCLQFASTRLDASFFPEPRAGLELVLKGGPTQPTKGDLSMTTAPITKPTTPKPAPTKREVQPDTKPRRTQKKVLSEIADDAVDQPEQYLKEAVAPEGE